MDIQTTKIELVKAILAIDNVEFIQKIKAFLIAEKADFWEELTLKEKAEIERGIVELNADKRVSFQDVLKRIS